MMKIIGKRKQRTISYHASGQLLKEGALFNDEIHQLPSGQKTSFPKGLYRYASHEEANEHWDACVINQIVSQNE